MEGVWRAAPMPAVRLWSDSDAESPRHELNAAALQWAAEAGVGADDWARLVTALRQWVAARAIVAAEGDAVTLPAGAQAVRAHWAPVADGGVAWLAPLAASVAGDAAHREIEGQRRLHHEMARAIALAGISVWHIDDASQTIHFNQMGREMVGLPGDRASMPVHEVRALIHPDDVNATLAAADAARRGDDVVDVIARYRNPVLEGWHTLLTRRVAVRDASGAVIGLAGVSLDLSALMTERERADELAQRARFVAETIGVGFWARDNEMGSAYWDEQLMRIFQRDPALGPPSRQDWLEQHVHPDDRGMLQARLALDEREWLPSSELTFRVATRDGSERWVRMWTRRVVRDGRRQSFGMYLDVTEQQRTETELQRERDRYRFAIDAAEVGVWERPLDGSPGYWNEAMYRLRGIDPADPRPIGELAALINDPDDQQRMDVLMRRHLEHGEPYETELRAHLPDGSVRWLATRGRRLERGSREVPVMAGINFDITERKQADALRQEMLRAEQASRDKSAFMARVSHELRTPMNAIVGFTDLLIGEHRGESDDVAMHRLGYIRSSARHLLALIDDVLDLAHLESAQPVMARERLVLRDAVDDAVRRIESLAREQGVEVDAAAVESGASVVADGARLRQVLGHLLSNAVQYNRPGGWVRVSLRTRDPAMGPPQGLVVADSGRGIGPGELSRIFEPFERRGADGVGAGSGIGLAIVRQLVDRMGGQIDARSQPGSGSEFVVWLPVADPAAAVPSVGTERAPGARGAALTVLCVEDNVVNLQLVRELFALRPTMRLFTAETGLDAVARAAEIVPDVVLLDMHLPDIDGTEVMRRLRTMPALAGTRYIALSANAMPDHVSSALRDGFDDYWTKPIDFAHFLGALDAMAAPPIAPDAP